MPVKPPRQRRFPGARVWALAQEAYLAGEPAASIAERLDLTENGIRKRAARHGWTRTKYAEAMKRAEDPAWALERLLARIGQRIEEGRIEEVSGLARAAADLARAARAAGPTAAAAERPRTQEEIEKMEAGLREIYEHVTAELSGRAEFLADQMLRDECILVGPHEWKLAALHWRARNLGRHVALSDLARHIEAGVASAYWTEDGRLHELPPDPSLPSERMLRQYVGACQKRPWPEADLTDFAWPPTHLAPPAAEEDGAAEAAGDAPPGDAPGPGAGPRLRSLG